MPRLSSNTRKFGQFWTPSPNIGIESSCEIDMQYLLPKDFCTLCDLYMNKRLLFGMLYPAYYSYKAVKTKNVKEYVSSMLN
ncbi:hypothetical protein Q9233_005978 [Columba guinea]|nr:hypothetical protein Q9233_005978 [Columba guinea]